MRLENENSGELYTMPAAEAFGDDAIIAETPKNESPDQLSRDRARYAALLDERYPHFNQRQRDFFIRACRERNLNPYANQIYADLRPGPRGKEEVALIVGITGLRLLAIRSGCHGGAETPQYDYADSKTPYRATKKIYRQAGDRRVEFVGEAMWEDYYPGVPGTLFDQKPHVCLGNCAEAAAIRQAFPEETGGLYIPEEMLIRRTGASGKTPLPPPGDDEPQTRQQVERELYERFGVSDPARRQAIINEFGPLPDDEQTWAAHYAAIFRVVKASPKVFGIEPIAV